MSENRKVIKDKVKGKPGADLIKELINKYNIDESMWYVDSFKIKDGKWNTSAIKRDQEIKWSIEEDKEGNSQQLMEGYGKRYPEFMMAENKTYSIEITFKRLPIEHNILDSFKRIVKKMPKSKYSNRKPMFKPGSGYALEISTFDAHLGKLAWEHETGYRNYDLKIASNDYKYVYEQILHDALPFEPEKIFIPLGQDIYHIDNMDGKTTHGTHSMDVDGRITKVNDIVWDVVLGMILEARKLAPVEVIWSPGNHDHFASYMLCFALAQYFIKDPLVTVDLQTEHSDTTKLIPTDHGKQIHKARLWGKTLVGFTHRIVGRHSNWANELAQSFPDLWAKSNFREWHHGDQHKKQIIKTHPVSTMGGVILRQITALSPVDKWHTENLFTDAVPGGEGYLWHKEKGVTGNLMAWTGQYTKYRNKLINNEKE